jgi:hypothetical protein
MIQPPNSLAAVRTIRIGTYLERIESVPELIGVLIKRSLLTSTG